MTTFLDEFERILWANRDEWDAVYSGTLDKPLLPFGKKQERYLKLRELAELREKYALPAQTDKRSLWSRDVVKIFDQANPYSKKQASIPENPIGTARKLLAERKDDMNWSAKLRDELEYRWQLECSWDEAGELYRLLVSDEPLPPLDRRETACYFAIEAITYGRAAPPAFNVKLVTDLHTDLRRRLWGKEPCGLAQKAPRALPALPNLVAAFDRALPTEQLLAYENAFWKAFGTFSRNLRFAYGRQGGWVAPYHGRSPEDKHAPRTDWGRRLIELRCALALLTNACYDEVRPLIELTADYSYAADAPLTRRLFYKPQRARLDRLTKEERGRRDRAEKRRHAEALRKIAADEQWRAQQRAQGAYGSPDEFDEAFGSCEFGNSYSYAWYTDRDTYNDVPK